MSSLTNKQKREIIYLCTGSINEKIEFQVRKNYFDGMLKYIGFTKEKVISEVKEMVNDPKMWDSLHPLNNILREPGEGKYWADRKTVDNYKKMLEDFLKEFE